MRVCAPTITSTINILINYFSCWICCFYFSSVHARFVFFFLKKFVLFEWIVSAFMNHAYTMNIQVKTVEKL